MGGTVVPEEVVTILCDFIGQFESLVTKLFKLIEEDKPYINFYVYSPPLGVLIVTEFEVHIIDIVNGLLV